MNLAPNNLKKFAFYGRTRAPQPARSAETVQERARQLDIATHLIASVNGIIVLKLFDNTSDPLATWERRQQARRLLGALRSTKRTFDAIVVGDTQITMSASQFDNLVQLRLLHNVELWCPEVAGAYKLDDAHHQDAMWHLF